MNVVSSIRKRFLHSARKELGVIIYSVVIGLVAWFLISMYVYPTTPKSIYGIPLTVDLSGSNAEASGLQVVSEDWKEIKVNVSIKGDRSQIGSLTAADLVARVNVDNVTTAGKYELEVEVTSRNGVEFTTESKSPRSVNLTFDAISTKELTNITASLPNVTAVEGMSIDTDNIAFTPAVVTVTGPSASLELLDHINVVVSEKRELSGTYTFTNCTQFMAYDASNKEIDLSVFDIIDVSSFSVRVPVYVTQTLPLDLNITQLPTNFNIDFLKSHLKFSEESITIGSQNKTIASYESWSLSSVRLCDIAFDYVADFEVKLNEGDTNISNFNTVQVSLDTEGLSTKEIIVRGSDISLLNAPANYDFEMQTKAVTVTLIGPAEDIANMTVADLVLTVDLSGYTVTDSSFNQSITIMTPHYNKVWAVNTNNAWIDASPKTTTTTH